MRTPLLCALLLAATGAPVAGQSFVPPSPRIGYEVVGESGPWVIVVHGGPGMPHTYLRPEWDTLAQAARVVYYDQRGCGWSDSAGDYRWQAHVADLDRLARHLAGSEPVVLAGSSWGSTLALLYADRHPERVRALVLSGMPPWPRVIGPPPGVTGIPLDQADFSPAERARIDSVVRGLPVGPLGSPDDTMIRGPDTDPDLYGWTGAEGKLPEGCPEVFRATNRSFATIPLLEELARIAVPALVVEGSGGILDGSADILRTLPHARPLRIEGGGHDPWLTQPQEFFQAVARFVQDPG